MKYTKHASNIYNIHLIKTDKFKKVTVKVAFKSELIKNEIVFRNALCNILTEASEKFPTHRLQEIASEELYNITYNSGTSISGKYGVLEFYSSFLNEKYTEPKMNEKSMQFFFDMIFNPLIINEGFEEKIYNNSLNRLEHDIKLSKENAANYAIQRTSEIVAKNSPISYRADGYIEDLEKITKEKLYKYYQKLLKESFIDIFVVGDIDEDDLHKIIKKNFKIKNTKKKVSTHYITHQSFRKNIKKVVEKSRFNQSSLVIGFKIEEMTPFERNYIGTIFNFIFGGGGTDSKLFKVVREENSLCYTVSSSIVGVAHFMTVYAGIAANDFDKATKLIKQEFKNMQEGNFTEADISNAKTTYLSVLKELEDSANSIIRIHTGIEYMGYDDLKTRAKKIMKVTKEDIINLAKKIHLDTVYLLEGGDTNEENSSI